MKRAICAAISVLLVVAMTGCSVTTAAVTIAPTDTTAKAEASAAAVMPSATATLAAAPTPTAAEATPIPSPTPTSTPKPDPLTVTVRSLNYSNEYIYVNVRYPEISGMADGAAQSGINSQVYAYLQDMADDIEAGYKINNPDESFGTYTMETDYEVERNDGGILSIRINTIYYNGGASTATDCAFINVVNTTPVQQPALAGLFAPGTDYTTVLNQRISAMIAADEDMEVYDFRGISSSQWYYLTDTALVIVFGQYSIAPGADGEPEFAIPLAELAGTLNPDIF